MKDFEKKHNFYEVVGNSTAQSTIDGKKAVEGLDKLLVDADAVLDYLTNNKK